MATTNSPEAPRGLPSGNDARGKETKMLSTPFTDVMLSYPISARLWEV